MQKRSSFLLRLVSYPASLTHPGAYFFFAPELDFTFEYTL